MERSVNSANRVLIIANLHKTNAGAMALEVERFFRCQGWEASTFSFEGNPRSGVGYEGYRLIVSLGGDGTLLYVARQAAALGIPVLPINLGTLGFIAANKTNSWRSAFEAWLEGELLPSARIMLDIQAERNQEILGRFVALNDGVVSSQGISKMIRLCLNVNDDCFGFYRVDVAIDETRRSGAMLTVDGQETLTLQQGDVVRFKRSEKDAMLVVPPENMFFQALRTKLGWSGDGHA
ncbi:MAG: NAD+ kinase [Spirochaetes bacterium]|nr:MAG: NAD+ kinase [Spirochaetota bacterium]